MKNIFLVIIPLFLIGCDFNNNNNNESDDQVESSPEDTTAFTQPLRVTGEQVVLVPEAREAVSDWLAYLIAESEVRNFHNYTVDDIISNAQPLAEIMENLRETVPDSLAVKSVESRLAVLYTKAKVVEHLSEKQNPNPEEIRQTAEQIPTEFNNFKIQLNEVFLKTLEDFEEELDNYEIDTIPLPENRINQINRAL